MSDLDLSAKGGPVIKRDTAYPRYEDLDIVPGDRGFLSWAYDPLLANASGNPTSGTIFGGRVKHIGGTVNRIHMCSLSQAVGGNAGQNFVGIYDAVTGLLLAQSADATAIFATVAPVQLDIPLSAPINLPPRHYDVVLLVNAATITAGLCRANGAAAITNAVRAGSGIPFRSFSADAGRTTLPASLGAKNAFTSPYWFALS